MTDNLPAVPDKPAELATLDTDSWRLMAAPILHLAETVAGTEFVPRGLRDSVPKTAAAMLYGREIGLPPLTSLAMLDVIEGKPGLSAEGMRMLVLSQGHDLEVVEKTGATCILRGRRRGSDRWHTVAWNIDMARAAGLAGKNVWTKYPRAMLFARCTTELCRDIFPDVIHGFRSLEELGDMAEGDDPAVVATTEAPAARRRVTRKRAAKVAAADPAALEGPRPDSPMVGPPLPGEEGYDSAPGGAVDGPGGPSEGAGVSVEGATDAPPVAPPLDPGAGDSTPPAPAHTSGEGQPPPGEGRTSSPGRKRSAAQHRMIMGTLGGLGVDVSDRDERLHITSTLIGRKLATSNDLLHTEASPLIERLAPLKTREDLDALLDEIEATNAGWSVGPDGIEP